MWFWVERVGFDAKIIDAVAAAAGGRGIFSGGCGFVAVAEAGSKFAEFAKRLMRVAGFAFWRGRILWHGWT
jgi:hypothetical protein